MHRLLLIVVLAGAACIGPTKTRGRVVGGVSVGFGSLLVITGVTTDCPETADFNEAIGCGIQQDVGPIMGGTLIAIGALILAANELVSFHEDPPAEAPSRSPVAVEPLPEPATSDPMLRRLTVQASVAARGGRCAAVAAIASRVAQLDASYRRDEFERDDKIAACLR